MADPAGRNLSPVSPRPELKSAPRMRNALRRIEMTTSSAPEESAAPDVGTRALLRLAGPILVAQLAVMGLAVIDTVMAGRLSAKDLAAVAVGSSIYVSVYVGFMGILQALTPIAGHHFGAGRFDEIGSDLVQALWLAFFLALIGVPLLAWTDLWLQLTGAPADVAEVASTYLHAIAFGLPAALATRAFVALNSAVSRPQVTMAIQLTALLAKVPLNLLFIYGAGPVPALGGAGCGVATAVLSYVTFSLSFLVWHLHAGFAPFRGRASLRPNWPRLRALLKLGLPSGGSLLIEVTSFTFIAIFLVRLGAQTLAGHQIMANLVSVLFMLPMALGVATGVLVAQSLGADAPVTARRAARAGFRAAAIGAAVAILLVWLLRERIVGAYTIDAGVAGVALHLVWLACLFHGFDAFQGVAGFVLRGYKVATAPMIIHGVSLWGIGLGGGYVLAFMRPAGWSMDGAFSFWLAAVAGLALTAAGLSWLTLRIANEHAAEDRRTQKGPD
jgi:MATE family multidrug resistance protein